MSCPTFDVLDQECMFASREDARAVMADTNARKSMSVSKYMQWKIDTRGNLERAEQARNTHVAECPTCHGDGKRPFITTDLPD
jgi:hypothetical protein